VYLAAKCNPIPAQNQIPAPSSSTAAPTGALATP
jgi:hypothetical protein